MSKLPKRVKQEVRSPLHGFIIVNGRRMDATMVSIVETDTVDGSVVSETLEEVSTPILPATSESQAISE